jgi:hypothetical protein
MIFVLTVIAGALLFAAACMALTFAIIWMASR